MGKRVFMLGLLAAFILSLSASALAAGKGGCTIDSMTTAYKTIYSADVHAGYFANIVVRVNLKNYESGENAPDYAVSADTLTWSLETLSGTLVRAKIVSVDKYEEVSTVDISNMGYAESTPVPYRVKLAGTISGDAVIRVIAALSGTNMQANDGVVVKSVDITFSSSSTATAYVTDSSAAAEDIKASSIEANSDTHDPRDPESQEWDGLEMPYTLTPGTVAAGVIPKITWAKHSYFRSGKENAIAATITGAVSEVNVYVAAKDAIRLFGVDKNSAVDIPLTSANVAQYNIPFRVTVIDDSKNVAVGDKKTDKAATTTVTLAFNGGKFELDGFPITISAKNSNNANKAAARTVRLNVTPNTSIPEWGVKYSTTVYSGDSTGYKTFTSVSECMTWVLGNPFRTISEAEYKYVRLDDAPVKYYQNNNQLTRYEFTDPNNGYVSGIRNFVTALGSDYDNWSSFATTADWVREVPFAEQRGNYWYAVIPTSMTVVSNDATLPTSFDVETFVSFDKKKPRAEIPTAIYPNAATEEEEGGVFGETYYVKGTAPLLITTGKQPKNSGGISIDITQPKFDYLGNNILSGCVSIHGTLEKRTRESNNLISITVSNPSTKKKSNLKVTVSSKTVPAFTEANTFKFDTSVLSTDTSDDIFTDEDYAYSADRAKVKSRRVTKPKLPKLKFKPSGSKKMTYKLGLYVWNDASDAPIADGRSAYSYLRSKFTGDPRKWHYMYGYVRTHNTWEEFGEEFNAELADKLAANNMSFDAKKGSIIALSKTAKTTSPTLNEAGDYFASMDIPITAVNSVGAAQAWGALAITGEKAKVADKSLVLTGSIQKGDVFKFKLLAGKTNAESVTAEGDTINIRSYTADDDSAQVLSDWGLELVNYDSMYILVNNEEWVRSKDVSYINYGLIQVIDPDKLAAAVQTAASADRNGKALKKLEKGKKIKLVFDNLGVFTKGKITICLKKDINSAGDPAAATNEALPASSGVALNKAAPQTAAKSGTAGSYIPMNGAAPEADSKSEAEETVSVTIGTPRTIANLTAGQKAYLAEKGYTVIAVLPEISAHVEGLREFDVTLDEDAPEGAKLVYIPFPKNAQPSEDDNIAEFYNTDGQFIDKVPAEKDITVAPWLREGVTYEPVIAVENAGLTF